MASACSVKITDVEKGLGRVLCVAQVLERERPFHKFMTFHLRGSVHIIPSYAPCFFRLQLCCQDESFGVGLACGRSQASDERTGIGGRLPFVGEQGVFYVWRSMWFSNEVTHHDWPGIFEMGTHW